MSNKTKRQRRAQKAVSEIFRKVAKQGWVQRNLKQAKAGRRYGITINLPLGRSLDKARSYYRVPGMKPLLHNGGKPR